MEIRGKIFTGMGVGKEYLSLEPYQKKIKDITGFEPFAGTLNLRCKQEGVESFLDSLEAERIDSFTFEGDKYSGINVYKVSLQGVDVAILRMDVTDYGSEVVEVVANDNLREELDLEDGDEVKLQG